MLAPPVMVVVFMPDEFISRGTEASVTAVILPKGNYGKGL